MKTNVEDLSPETEAFFNHLTHRDTSYELIHRRNQLRHVLINDRIKGRPEYQAQGNY